jgi:hypothetical protein
LASAAAEPGVVNQVAKVYFGELDFMVPRAADAAGKGQRFCTCAAVSQSNAYEHTRQPQ